MKATEDRTDKMTADDGNGNGGQGGQDSGG